MLAERRKNVPPIVISVPPTTPRSPNSARTKSSRKSFRQMYASNPRPTLPFITTEKDLLTSPEELVETKFHLIQDIEQLHAEMDPMIKEIRQLEEGITEEDFEKERKIAELDQNYQELVKEHKRLSDRYGDSVLESTKNYIEQQQKQLEDLSKKIEDNELAIVNVESESKSDDLMAAEEFYNKQNEVVRDLRQQYRELKKEEDELNSQLCGFFNEQARQKNNQQIERLKRELHGLRQQNMNKRQEIDSLKKTHNMKTQKIRNTMSARSQREKEERERKAFNDKMLEKKKQQNEQMNEEFSKKEKNQGFVFDTFMKGEQKKKLKTNNQQNNSKRKTRSQFDDDFVSSNVEEPSIDVGPGTHFIRRSKNVDKEDMLTQTFNSDFYEEEEEEAEFDNFDESNENVQNESENNEEGRDEKDDTDIESEKDDKDDDEPADHSEEEEIILELAVNVVAESITPNETDDEASESTEHKLSPLVDDVTDQLIGDVNPEEEEQSKNETEKPENEENSEKPEKEESDKNEEKEGNVAERAIKDESENKNNDSETENKKENGNEEKTKNEEKKEDEENDSDIVSDPPEPEQQAAPLENLMSNLAEKVAE